MARVISFGYRKFNLHGLVLVALAGAWLAGSVLDSLLPLPAIFFLLTAGVALVFLWLLREDRPALLIMGLLLCALLGAWRYSSTAASLDPLDISHFIGRSHLVSIRGDVTDEPKLLGHGYNRLLVIAVNSISQNGGNWHEAHGKLAVTVRGSRIEDPYSAGYGDQVELSGKLQGVTPYDPVGTSASMAFAGITAHPGGNPLLAWLYHFRVSLATLLAQTLPQPEAALMIAILLGLHTPALQLLTSAFSVTGTAHIIAPSGLKVTLLSGLVAKSLKLPASFLGQKKPLVRAKRLVGPDYRNWNMWLSIGLRLICIAGYTVLSGAGPAAIRAGVMGALLVIAPLLDRKYNVYTALALIALLLSILDPLVLWDASFLLSFIGTLGVLLFTPYIEHWFSLLLRLPFGAIVTENIAVTLAAQIATWPIIAITFQNISFIAVFANVLTVPLLTPLILLGAGICLAGLLFAPIAQVIGWVAWPLLWYVIQAIAVCAQIPGAYILVSSFPIGLAWSYYATLALGYWWARKQLLAAQALHGARHPRPYPYLPPRIQRFVQPGVACTIILATGISMLVAQNNVPFTLTFLAVGPADQPLQGEAILVRTAANKTILIDGGLDTVSLAQQLDSCLPPWQHSLDAVVLTSPRRDHIYGLLDILQRYQITEVVDAGMLHPDTTYALWRRTITERSIQYVSVVQGTTIPIGNVSLQILWPLSQLHKGSNEVRDNSLVVRLLAPGLRILLLGATAQSPYALSRLSTELSANYLQAEIVQIVGEVGKAFPGELGAVLQQAHPAFVVVTPAALSLQQRKRAQQPVQTLAPVLSSIAGEASWQTIETEQVGTVEITSSQDSWHIQST